MTEQYEPVDVAEVMERDEVTLNGFAVPVKGGQAVDFTGDGWSMVGHTGPDRNIPIWFRGAEYWVRRTSVVRARRRVEPKPEAKCECHHCTHTACPRAGKCVHCLLRPAPPAPPKQEAEPVVGSWRDWNDATRDWCPCTRTGPGENCHITRREVRRSTGWSRDQRVGERRKGAPWVLKDGDPVTLTLNAQAGRIARPCEQAIEDVEGRQAPIKRGGESYSDYYKRVGLDVRPVERRKSDRRKTTR